MATIFYTAVDGSVTGPLDARKAYYASEERNTGAHSWLVKKMAYASATAKGNTGSASVATPTKGGLARTNGSGKSTGGLYKGAGSRTKSGESTQPRFIPRPHINSVSVSSTGDFGSIVKCEVKFSVYSLADLGSMQPFFQIGGDIGVNYGWNSAGGAGGKAGRFQGKIYNFNYAVNANGGFDCTSYGMGPGINVLSANADAPKDSKGETVTDPELEDIVKHSNDIINKISNDCTNLPDLVDATDPATGIGAVKFETDWGTPPERTDEEESDDEPGEPQTQYYVSLARIVGLINEMVLEAGGPVFSKIKIICDSNTTKGNAPKIEPFASANPMEVLFPGKATYSEEKTFTFGSIDSAFTSDPVDLSLCMFHVEWVKKMFEEMGKKTDKNQKSADSTVANLLKQLFDVVSKNSGNLYKLTTASDPKDTTGNRILIVDGSYIDTKISPYEITTVTQRSICRSVTLQSKVPSEMATAAMVAANAPITNHNPGAFALLNPGGGGGTTPAATATPLPDAIKAIGVGGVTPENVKSAQTAIIAALAPNNDGSVPIPVDFSCTLDGIEGFVFGNAITCNYLPPIFKQNSLCFTVTTVSHEISGNDWTTTLNTVCRTIPK
jgi:hypothetical protein